MNSYSASTQDYINCLSQRLPFPFTVSKVVDSFNNCEYLVVTIYGTTPFTFPYDRDFYSLVYHIANTIQSLYPELFI